MTIPEGLTAAQVAALLEEQGYGGRDVFRCVMEDVELLQEFALPATGVEGYLFPDTYAFAPLAAPTDIVRAMLARFRQESAALAARRAAAGLSEVEMVTLASVIEKETGQADERKLISGVFHNRLRLGMPLQSDPTVLYGRSDGARADHARRPGRPRPVQHLRPSRPAARSDRQPGPRRARGRARAGRDQGAVLRLAQRRLARVLRHARGAQPRRAPVPAATATEDGHGVAVYGGRCAHAARPTASRGCSSRSSRLYSASMSRLSCAYSLNTCCGLACVW